MITLKQLTYTLALSQTLHFRKAAEMCSVSQSAFSSALSEMEKQLGFQVFERNNKKVLITPLGQQVIDKAKDIKLRVDDLHALADSFKEPLISPLSIGIIPTISSFLLPIVLPNLQLKYPKLQMNLYEEQSNVLVDKVREGDIDVAVLALPFSIDGLLSFKFWDENFFWVCHKDHASSHSKEIVAGDLDLSELMLLSEGHCLKDHALSVCHLDRSPNLGMSATSLSTLVHLVAGNLGTTLVPEMAIPQLVDLNKNLKAIKLAEKGPHREIAFIVRPNYPLINNIELLIKVFKESLSKQFKK
ncbi:MAG: hydrogen peroxide-inducible genes activator [Gammaproteobacteria bacterium]|nr:hydrogen peroxide-inducible genes activator [Gammaproteobacteria bacterium]